MNDFLFLPRAFAGGLFNIAFAYATGLILLACLSVELRSRIHRLLRGCWALVMVTQLLELWLTVATVTGSAEWRTLRAACPDVLIGTHAGLMAVCCSVVAVLGFLSSVTMPVGGVGRGFAAATILLLAGFRSASGHAAVSGSFSAAEFGQLLHLLSTATWSGCILVSGIFISQMQTDNGAGLLLLMRRVSRIAAISVVFVLVTGMYNSYRSIGTSLQLLDHSLWGSFLIAKVTFVGFALGLGAYSRSIVHSRVEIAAAKSTRLSAAVRIEAVVMILILCLSAFLANSPSPMQS